MSELALYGCVRARARSDAPSFAQEPKPEQIRPYHVLQETLTQLKKRWREKATYNWICSQFKSLRQDLTVRPQCSCVRRRG